MRTCERRWAEASASLFARASAARREASTRSAASLFYSCDFSFCIDTTMPEGMCVMRTAESVVLTDWPPGPLER